MRCLWLSGDVPYPRLSGRRIYTAGLAGALAGAGVSVVAMGTMDDQIPPESSDVEWRPVPPTSSVGTVRNLTSRWPSMAVNRRTEAYRAAVDQVLEEGGWDVAVVDHLQMCWTLPALVGARLPIVYVSHNHESSSRHDIAVHHPWRHPMKVPLMFDSWRAGRGERELVARSALVTAVTDVDAARFRHAGAHRVRVLMPGYSGPVLADRTISEETPRVAVMVTNLEWHVKRTNLLRLLEVAEPVLAAAGIELRVVGSVPRDFVEGIGFPLRATRFLGPVDCLDDELAAARVGVICERDGGGFKLKALDYTFRRVPMAVLTGSMEGMPLTPCVDYASAPSEQALARAVVDLVNSPAECQRMQRSAFDRCAARFDWSERGTDLAVALEDIDGVS